MDIIPAFPLSDRYHRPKPLSVECPQTDIGMLISSAAAGECPGDNAFYLCNHIHLVDEDVAMASECAACWLNYARSTLPNQIL